MRPVNLIPPEERRGQRAPLRTGALAYVLLGGLVLAFGGVYMLVSTGNSISEKESQLTGLEQELEASRARAEALQSFTEFATLEDTRTQTITGLARSRFDWERVMRELALVIPSDVSLDTVTGKVSAAGAGSSEGGAPAAGSGETSEGIDAPSMTISGCAATHDSVARFVAALRDIDGVTRVGLESSEKSSDDAAASGGAPAPSGAATADSSGSCVNATTFKLIVAFDGVEVDPTSGIVVPTEPPAAAADEAGVADAKAEQASAKESADDAVKKSNEAIDRYVPGA